MPGARHLQVAIRRLRLERVQPVDHLNAYQTCLRVHRMMIVRCSHTASHLIIRRLTGVPGCASLGAAMSPASARAHLFALVKEVVDGVHPAKCKPDFNLVFNIYFNKCFGWRRPVVGRSPSRHFR